MTIFNEKISRQFSLNPIESSMFTFSGIGPQYGKRATVIFACGDQTFFKVDESILTGAMLSKINVVADKSTICKLLCWSNSL